MKYFKAGLTIENSQKKYGNLPIGFVIGYENTNLDEAYFCLYEEVVIPNSADIHEISKAEYDSAIETIKEMENEKKQTEIDEMIKIIADKNGVIGELQDKNIVLNQEIEEIQQQNVTYMLAMTDMYEEQLISEQRHVETMMALTEIYEVVTGGN